MKTKGIALIYDPHNLYEFEWYYATYGNNIAWTALCLPNGGRGEYMSNYCRKSGIFEEIISGSKIFLEMEWKEKLKTFIQMFFYAIIGQQTKYCKKIIRQYINCDEYEIAVVLTDSGIVSGAFIGLGREKKVVILEDGLGDYEERSIRYLLKNITSTLAWQGFFLALLGYSCPTHRYRLKTTRYCEKYCSILESMNYKEYKKMNQLYDLSNTDKKLLNTIMKNTYGDLSKYNFEQAEAIFFTDCLYDFTPNAEVYLKKLQEYINKHYKHIILKRHPRDIANYSFSEDIEVDEIDATIPAEVIITNMMNCEVILMFATSILLSLSAYECKVTCLWFKELFKENKKNNFSYGRYLKKEDLRKELNRFGFAGCPIIEL